MGEVVARGHRDRVHAAGVAGEAGDELRVGAPAVGREQRRAVRAERLPQHDEPQRDEPGERVLDARHAQQAGHPEPGPPQAPGRRTALLHELRHDEIRPGLDALHHLVHALGRVHEIGVQRDDAVALGAVGLPEREPEQLFQAPRVALALPVRDDAHREHLGVGCQHVTRTIGRGVIQHQELVLAGKGGEDLPHLPQHQARGAGLVVRRYADVNHGPAI